MTTIKRGGIAASANQDTPSLVLREGRWNSEDLMRMGKGGFSRLPTYRMILQ